MGSCLALFWSLRVNCNDSVFKDRISLTAHDAPTGFKRLKLWDEISDREWLRYLTVEPLNTESLVLTTWGLLQYLKGLLQSLRLLTS